MERVGELVFVLRLEPWQDVVKYHVLDICCCCCFAIIIIIITITFVVIILCLNSLQHNLGKFFWLVRRETILYP